MYIDVFNGDADGICSLLQLRLAQPVDSTLITGVKRDISLLARVRAQRGDQVTVLDVSLDKNRPALLALLQQSVDVLYFDHHQAGDIPQQPNLQAIIDTRATICTGLLVNTYLNHQYSRWAIVAAFGDNLSESALALAQQQNLNVADCQQLQQLGVCLNYNGYGESEQDLHFPPAQLFRVLLNYPCPLQFIADDPVVFRQLRDGYAVDMQLARQIFPDYQADHCAVYVLPDQKWARRVSGVWSNQLANQAPDKAHAVLSIRPDGDYVVSVRAPLNQPWGADVLCASFVSGGGRKAAAGINRLPASQLADFTKAFELQFKPTH